MRKTLATRRRLKGRRSTGVDWGRLGVDGNNGVDGNGRGRLGVDGRPGSTGVDGNNGVDGRPGSTVNLVGSPMTKQRGPMTNNLRESGPEPKSPRGPRSDLFAQNYMGFVMGHVPPLLTAL